MTNAARNREASAIRALISKYSKISETRPLKSDEYQELHLLQSRLDALYQNAVNRSVSLMYDGQDKSAIAILESLLP